jgi:hypothetical protein
MYDAMIYENVINLLQALGAGVAVVVAGIFVIRNA